MGGEVVVAGGGAGQLEAVCLDWDSPASLVVVCGLAREGDQLYREEDNEYREGNHLAKVGDHLAKVEDQVYSFARCRKESSSTAPDCPRYLRKLEGTSDLY